MGRARRTGPTIFVSTEIICNRFPMGGGSDHAFDTHMSPQADGYSHLPTGGTGAGFGGNGSGGGTGVGGRGSGGKGCSGIVLLVQNRSY